MMPSAQEAHDFAATIAGFLPKANITNKHKMFSIFHFDELIQHVVLVANSNLRFNACIRLSD